MGQNPETKVIKAFREMAEERGFIVTRITDRFTRGILDTMVETRLGPWLVEFKLAQRRFAQFDTVTWSQLGLSGAQDERVTRGHALHGMSVVVSGTRDCEWFGMWTPMSNVTSPTGEYMCRVVGLESILKKME